MNDWAAELFDKASVEIPCTECGNKIQETLGRLKNDPNLICGICGFGFTINAEQFRESMREVNDAIDNLRKKFGAQ
jgi:transcription elongation factor Elf1